MPTAQCQLCYTQQWQIFSHISFGIWDESGQVLTRKSSDYPLSTCQHCGHVQISSKYTSKLFKKLYFHSKQEAVMWHESLVNDNRPYEEMINFALGDSAPEIVVDLGCGEGKLLEAANRATPKSTLIGIDFNNRFSQNNIRYLSFDLNHLNNLPNNYWPNGIDLAMASHVLEHVINPVEFLRQIKKQLSPNGVIFIEVPDFSERHNIDSIGMSNLINLQHIHYFTADSLTYAAQLAGLEVTKLTRVTTGYIPRLLVLLSPSQLEQICISALKFNTADVICHYQAQCRALRSQLANVLREKINQQGKVGLWGIGADFYTLINENTDLNKHISKGDIVLFDYVLKDKEIQSQRILCSSNIPTFNYNVFMSPILAETRIKMRAISRDWHNVIDYYFKENE